MKAKDSRMRILEEMMNGVKVIKYNSMENFFKQRVKYKLNSLRKKKINLLDDFQKNK